MLCTLLPLSFVTFVLFELLAKNVPCCYIFLRAYTNELTAPLKLKAPPPNNGEADVKGFVALLPSFFKVSLALLSLVRCYKLFVV